MKLAIDHSIRHLILSLGLCLCLGVVLTFSPPASAIVMQSLIKRSGGWVLQVSNPSRKLPQIPEGLRVLDIISEDLGIYWVDFLPGAHATSPPVVSATPGVKAFVKNQLITIEAQPTPTKISDSNFLIPSSGPNDPMLSKQWYLDNTSNSGGKVPTGIYALEAWGKITDPESEITVGVMDTGIDRTHEDLKEQIWKNPDPTAKEQYGADMVEDDGDPQSLVPGHGTHVAGILGATVGNALGIAGVSRNTKILSIRVFDELRRTSIVTLLKGYEFARKNVKILNCSFAGSLMVEDKPQEAYKIYSSMMEKLRDDGVLVIAAAGNAPFGQPKDIETYRLYPAMFPLDNIIIVAATDQNGALASFSNFGGNTVSIAAPGKNIWSTLPGSKYGADDGTSMATPLVAGVAALLWSQKPSVGYQRVRDAILHGATSSKKLEGKVIGSRFLNASKSLDEIRK